MTDAVNDLHRFSIFKSDALSQKTGKIKIENNRHYISLTVVM